jgi:hypothetical protein
MSLKKVKFNELCQIYGGNMYLLDEVGATDQTISDIKCGRTVPRLELALQLDKAAEKKGLKIDWLDLIKKRKIISSEKPKETIYCLGQSKRAFDDWVFDNFNITTQADFFIDQSSKRRWKFIRDVRGLQDFKVLFLKDVTFEMYMDCQSRRASYFPSPMLELFREEDDRRMNEKES